MLKHIYLCIYCDKLVIYILYLVLNNNSNIVIYINFSYNDLDHVNFAAIIKLNWKWTLLAKIIN